MSIRTEIEQQGDAKLLQARRTFSCGALTGLMADTRAAGTPEQLAKTAWRIADAMLATELETLPEDKA